MAADCTPVGGQSGEPDDSAVRTSRSSRAGRSTSRPPATSPAASRPASGATAAADSILMTFPVEGWAASAVVQLRQDADGILRGEVFGDGDLESIGRQAARSLSLDHDGSGWPDVGRRDPVDRRASRSATGSSARSASSRRTRPRRVRHRPADLDGPDPAGQGAARPRMAGDAVAVEAGRRAADVPAVPAAAGARSRSPEMPGLAAVKVERLHGLARAALDGRLDTERLRALPDDEALAELRDAAGDRRVDGERRPHPRLRRRRHDHRSADRISREAVRHFYELADVPDDEAWLAIAEPWRPYRMWATVLLHLARGAAEQPGRRRPRLTPPRKAAAARSGHGDVADPTIGPDKEEPDMDPTPDTMSTPVQIQDDEAARWHLDRVADRRRHLRRGDGARVEARGDRHLPDVRPGRQRRPLARSSLATSDATPTGSSSSSASSSPDAPRPVRASTRRARVARQPAAGSGRRHRLRRARQSSEPRRWPMDAPSLVTLAAVVAAAVVIVPRLVLESAGRASDGIAQLFVPPDRALGWPRGVQEGDDPWGWRSPAEVGRVQAADQRRAFARSAGRRRPRRAGPGLVRVRRDDRRARDRRRRRRPRPAGRPGTEPGQVPSPVAASRSAASRRSSSRPRSRRRSCWDSDRFRSRIDCGVTSTSSSPAMNSIADLEGERPRRRQPERLVVGVGPDVRQLLLLGRVDVHVARPAVLADDHPLVDLFAGADEQLGPLLRG